MPSGATLPVASLATATARGSSEVCLLHAATWQRPDVGSCCWTAASLRRSRCRRTTTAPGKTAGVDPDRLDPVLLDFSNRRAAMKAKYLGDLFPASAFAAPGVLYRDFFRTDRNGVEKGVVLIDLGSLP